MNLPNKSTYKAYTLFEMLIVLLIFMIISAIGISGFLGFRDTVTINEDVNTLKQRVSLAQRAALFLERSSTERWIYGIGIDFTDISSTGTYRVFKWCSPDDEYGQARSKSALPNYDPNFPPLSVSNGNMGVLSSYVNTKCSLGESINEIVKLDNTIDDEMSSNYAVNIVDNSTPGDVATGKPEYLLFESVSGKAFFYDDRGYIVNYGGGGDMVADPINLIIEINSTNTGVGKRITIYNISGKVKVENI